LDQGAVAVEREPLRAGEMVQGHGDSFVAPLEMKPA
jgi:hypothetical protein